MPPERRQSDRDSRDLLVELKVNVSNLTQEFKEFKENLGGRILTIESDLKEKVKFQDIEALRSAFSKENFVTKEELEPIKRIVYGVVTVILVTVVGAILALVISNVSTSK